jgi:hypothetical protein
MVKIIEKIINSSLKIIKNETKLSDLDVIFLDDFNISHDEWVEKGCKHYFKEFKYVIGYNLTIYYDVPYGDYYVVTPVDKIIIGYTQNNFSDHNWSIKEDNFIYQDNEYIIKNTGELFIKL